MSEAHTADHDDGIPEGPMDGIMKETKEKILYILGIYPYLSRPMLQYGLGPSLPPKLWSPCLAELMMEGKVKLQRINTVNPKQVSQTKDVYHLPQFPYPPVTTQQLELAEELAGLDSDSTI